MIIIKIFQLKIVILTPVKNRSILNRRVIVMALLVKSLHFLYEPRHEKTGFLHMRKNKDAYQLCGNREADQRLCFRYTDSTIPLLPTSKISSL